ncbi:MAG: gliding motility lipoprotein GldH [Chitinophagia bacterium]
MKTKLLLLLVIVLTVGCRQLNVFEQLHPFPNHEWASADSCIFRFRITDTAARYHIYAILRHEDAYHFNNIWMEVGTQPPRDTLKKQTVMLTLGDNTKGWLGVGMDDVFDQRIRITRNPIPLVAGEYTFTLKQIMREDPLQNVLQAGIRVEKFVP